MICPRCRQPVEPSGVVSIDEAELIVYQCNQCTVPWQVGGSTFETALTFAVSESGQFFDPESGQAIALN